MGFLKNFLKRTEQSEEILHKLKKDGPTSIFKEAFLIETISKSARCFGSVVVRASYGQVYIYTGMDHELVITIEINTMKMESVKSYERLMYTLERTDEFDKKHMLEELKDILL